MTASVANEVFFSFDLLEIFAAVAALFFFTHYCTEVLVTDQLLVSLGSVVQGHPDAAQLSKGSKLRALELVDVMMESVAGFNEFRGMRFDGELYFA